MAMLNNQRVYIYIHIHIIYRAPPTTHNIGVLPHQSTLQLFRYLEGLAINSIRTRKQLAKRISQISLARARAGEFGWIKYMFFQKFATRVLLFHWINQGTD